MFKNQLADTYYSRICRNLRMRMVSGGIRKQNLLTQYQALLYFLILKKNKKNLIETEVQQSLKKTKKNNMPVCKYKGCAESSQLDILPKI